MEIPKWENTKADDLENLSFTSDLRAESEHQ